MWLFTPWQTNGIDLCVIKNLLLYIPWLAYAISVESYILSNKVMKYLSGISLELYLAQMVIYRFVEKIHGLYLFGKGWGSFLIAWIGVVAGLIVFIYIWKRVWEIIKHVILRLEE